jgi:hypothetical protein
MTDAIESKIHEQRAHLENTLDAIEEKLNVPKQVSRYTGKAKVSYEKNPVPWIAGAAAAAVGVVSIVTWALLSGDE